jgi:hypothetical protein
VDELMEFPLEAGGTVVVEVDIPLGMSRVAHGDGLVTAAKTTFETALTAVRDAASSALDQLRSMSSRPDGIEIRFGVKLTAQAGAVIAKTGGEGTFEVKLVWKRPPEA